MNPSRTRTSNKRRLLYLGLACVAMLGAGIYFRVHAAQMGAALLRTPAEDLLKDPSLIRFAEKRAPMLYQENCAACHGADLKGSHDKGAPNLTDAISLYGNGAITDIETTILYGIRSGHPKAHNVTDMPGLGRTGQLSKQDVHDVVDYVLLMSQQPHDATAADRGRKIYNDAGVCYDCHASDGYGVSDYGAPGLTARGGAWVYGGDRDALYKSVYDGRHGLCPAWINKLSFVQIRALAVYLYEASHKSPLPGAPPQAGEGNSTAHSLPSRSSLIPSPAKAGEG